ncbi:hypothetical protein [Legionella brunensis]|uniref:Uncharacterized protein n=1 Tax=Legionella brunensis TaxID=29422 RepID=A0A0W0SSM1_9GAMM|nr:hypothetical protein [Legionella brunensis]KTC86390.1 hypothetical protein Lbru_0331 [Legionella brunensis]
MTPAKDLPMVIEKSQDEIEQIIALVQSSNLPEETFPALEEIAANGSLIHNDDTVLRIVDTIRHNGNIGPPWQP